MSDSKEIYLVDGPKGVCVVWGREAIEPAIAMLAQVYGDDPDDYTATRLSKVELTAHPTSIVKGK